MTVELRDVTLDGRGRPRLAGVEVRFGGGTVYGLVGPNGAGKTSLMATIAGLALPSRGEVVWAEGRAPVIGAVFADGGLHVGRTVTESLVLRARYTGASSGAVEAALRSAGLVDVARKRVRTLSLGMRVRLTIAVALIGDPDVVLLDEPMNGLDPNGVVWVEDLVKDLRQRGATVIISSHLLRELERLIDVAVVMSVGKITSVEDMRHDHARGSALEVSDCEVMAELLRAEGASASVEGSTLITDLRPESVARIAVQNGLEVLSLVPRTVDLHRLYERATSGEHVAAASR